MSESRKVLVSPTHGSEWAALCEKERGLFLATYQPIIEAIEDGTVAHRATALAHQLELDLISRFGVRYYQNGEPQHVDPRDVLDLHVVAVRGPFRLLGFDGAETLETPDSIEWW